MAEAKRYWMGTVPEFDDFGGPLSCGFYDAKTIHGPWAIMNNMSWVFHGIGRLGTGYGQYYERQEDGRWMKTLG